MMGDFLKAIFNSPVFYLIVIAILLGVIIYLLFLRGRKIQNDLITKYLQKNWNFIISSITAMVTFIYLMVDNQKFETSYVTIAFLASIVSLLVTLTHKLNIYQITFEGNQDTLGKFLKLLSTNPKIAKLVNYSYEASNINNEFYKHFQSKVFDIFNNQLNQMSQGTYTCDPETELNLTTTILECCNKSLKAISYEDEVWWTSHNGTLYLDAHSKHIDRKNEKAIRIFLIKESDKEKLKPVFLKHKELEIETYILYTDKDDIDSKYKIDFVIYDDFMLRRAENVKASEVGKKAYFTSKEIEVEEYKTLFNQILTIAKSKANTNILPE